MKKTMFYLISMLLLASCQKDVIEKKENEEKKEQAPAQSLCDYSQSGTVRYITTGGCKNWYIEQADGKFLAPSTSLDDFTHLKYDGAEILFSYELAPFPYDQCNVMPQTVVHIICADLKSNNPKP